jgi:hypothetical protein
MWAVELGCRTADEALSETLELAAGTPVVHERLL